MLLAAMLAMVLVAAAPAFAQVTSDDDTEIQFVDCSQVVAIAANQGQYGDAEDEAAIAAELNITVEQVNGCLGGVAIGDEGADDHVNGTDDDGDGTVDETDEAAASDDAAASEGSAAAAASGGTLPDTGGASLLALGAGALLVGGGLLARRIVR
jgi:hypothetical protein